MPGLLSAQWLQHFFGPEQASAQVSVYHCQMPVGRAHLAGPSHYQDGLVKRYVSRLFTSVGVHLVLCVYRPSQRTYQPDLKGFLFGSLSRQQVRAYLHTRYSVLLWCSDCLSHVLIRRKPTCECDNTSFTLLICIVLCAICRAGRSCASHH